MNRQLSDFGLVGVKQTLFGRGIDHNEPPGNCMQAALATVLGLRLDQVPHFLAYNDWWAQCNAWLLKRYALHLLNFKWTSNDWPLPPVVHFMIGRTVRNSDHVVVAFAGETIFDPHPSDAGLSEPNSVEVFITANPSNLLSTAAHRALFEARA